MRGLFANYHTDTFRIDRENAPADAPIENLVLNPLPDGTYKELLVSYNLTVQEKLPSQFSDHNTVYEEYLFDKAIIIISLCQKGLFSKKSYKIQ